MKRHIFILLLFCTKLTAQTTDWSSIENIFGRKGTVRDQVFKVAFPRTDLKVTVGQVLIDPALTLTSWIAFKKTDAHTMIMGDLVLLDSEVATVMSKLILSGLDVSALHNHIMGESPRIMYMHFSGHGDDVKLAEAILSVLKLTGTPLAPPQSTQPSDTTYWREVESILGLAGHRAGRVLQFGVPRTEPIIEKGVEVPPFMGMATAINMQMIQGKIATTGDFVLLADEVNPVIKALIHSGIVVTALHNHMLFESPRLFFLHFWGFDKPERITMGLKSALEKTNSLKRK